MIKVKYMNIYMRNDDTILWIEMSMCFLTSFYIFQMLSQTVPHSECMLYVWCLQVLVCSDFYSILGEAVLDFRWYKIGQRT